MNTTHAIEQIVTNLRGQIQEDWVQAIEHQSETLDQQQQAIAAAREALEGLLDQIENGQPFTGSPIDMERASVTAARAALAQLRGERP